MKRLLAALFLVFATALPVNAHSSLVSATPAENSVLKEFPSEISLTFNENLLEVGEENPNTLRVSNGVGMAFNGEISVEGSTISAPLGITGNGTFLVRYRVVSQDGHVIENGYQFTVDSDAATTVVAPNDVMEIEAEDGPNLLVRSAMALAAGAAFLVLLWFRKRK